jgi:arginyl-tRNA synthetase
MKININNIRTLPEGNNFGFCVYGEPSDEIIAWANYWGFKVEKVPVQNYTNILVPMNYDISECFEKFSQYKYVDGFSPNLNKHLHIGHMSNFIIAKAFQSMGVGSEFVSILGDTLEGDVDKKDAFNMFNTYCEVFDFNVDNIYYASDMIYMGGNLESGEGEYDGTMVFNIDGEKIVGIKSDGSTSYFYQDAALAEMLDAPTLYLTGSEQENHFKTLHKLYPNISHVGLGLVKVWVPISEKQGKFKQAKMSSRDGNVIYFEDLLKACLEMLNNDYELVYNVLAGFILKVDPKKDKSINTTNLYHSKNSPGLYLSYTLARLTSAGVRAMKTDKFNDSSLQFKYMKAMYNLQPNILFNALVDHCKKINGLYETHKIEGNPENEVMFSNFKEDLELGMKTLGLFLVDKV